MNLDRRTANDLRQLLEYMRESEQKHYLESGRSEKHIFVKVQSVQQWLDRQTRNPSKRRK